MKRLTIFNLFKKHPLLFILGVVGLIVVTIGLAISVESVIFIILVIAEIALAFSMGQVHLQKFGIELVTVTAVLGGVLHGPTTGMTLGIILSIFHYLLSQSFGPYLFYSIPLFGLIGFLAGILTGINIVVLGIVLSLVYNITTATLGTLATGNLPGEIMWSGSNFAFNVILFTRVVPALI